VARAAVQSWRLLVDPPGSAAWNMSVDEALLACSSEAQPAFRLYTWRAPSVSLGYRQARSDWLERCAALGVEPVRRITGGGAVLHAGDLTYSTVVPRSFGDVPDDLHGSYAWIRAVLLDGLRALGLDARPSRSQAQAERLGVCFSGSTGLEIDLSDVKLVGSAQRRTARAFLQHGSIRMRDDSELYRRLLGTTPGPPPAGLGELEPAAVAESIEKALRTALGGALERSSLSAGERQVARKHALLRAREPLSVPSAFLK
jgi:lipoate-protein ligase A